jgi:hypothetical protein
MCAKLSSLLGLFYELVNCIDLVISFNSVKVFHGW